MPLASEDISPSSGSVCEDANSCSFEHPHESVTSHNAGEISSPVDSSSAVTTDDLFTRHNVFETDLVVLFDELKLAENSSTTVSNLPSVDQFATERKAEGKTSSSQFVFMKE